MQFVASPNKSNTEKKYNLVSSDLGQQRATYIPSTTCNHTSKILSEVGFDIELTSSSWHQRPIFLRLLSYLCEELLVQSAMQRSRVIHDRCCRYPLLGLPSTHLEILFLQTCVEVAWLRHACDNYLRSHVPKQMFTYAPCWKKCCLAISGLAKLGYTSEGPEMSRY